RSSLQRFAADLQLGAMMLQYHGDERQPQSHAGAQPREQSVIAFGREVRLRTAAANLVRHADAVVLHFENRRALSSSRAQHHSATPAGRGDQGLAILSARLTSERRPRLVTEMIAHLERGITGVEKQVLERLLQVR